MHCLLQFATVHLLKADMFTWKKIYGTCFHTPSFCTIRLACVCWQTGLLNHIIKLNQQLFFLTSCQKIILHGGATVDYVEIYETKILHKKHSTGVTVRQELTLVSQYILYHAVLIKCHNNNNNFIIYYYKNGGVSQGPTAWPPRLILLLTFFYK